MSNYDKQEVDVFISNLKGVTQHYQGWYKIDMTSKLDSIFQTYIRSYNKGKSNIRKKHPGNISYPDRLVNKDTFMDLDRKSVV